MRKSAFLRGRGKGKEGTPKQKHFISSTVHIRSRCEETRGREKPVGYKRNVITLLDICFQSSFLAEPPCYSKQEEQQGHHLGAGEKCRATPGGWIGICMCRSSAGAPCWNSAGALSALWCGSSGSPCHLPAPPPHQDPRRPSHCL